MTIAASQEAFLHAFHAEHPAVTSEWLGHGRAPDGRSSYELLRDRVAGRERVLDLGCGDGLLLDLLAGSDSSEPSAGRERPRQLTGVDLSPQTLALARKRPALADTRLEEARAQELPFPDSSFDACVSHMALMLMADIEQVAVEVARVLAPGGVLACVVGNGVLLDEAYDRFRALAKEEIADTPAAKRMPTLGDRRTRTREGFDAILGPAGFAPVEWESVAIDLGGPVDRVWTGVASLYDFEPLDQAAMERLRGAFLDARRDSITPEGTVPFTVQLRLASAELR
ncbi:class I SAM-dependent methyltransferase [Catenulispora sp. NF23]|uniref:class I SAM-dependent methyltransferase n=1 Tax=Catenulispora pinistramenti TaxID=2705254 RepID=UPI001BA8DB24|nr:class I SAM-dependent methyltransferase [Catenulispora pinistramenti]MBS2538887.1 class I SAM-dependent methyltransferase [Catenulispora pinistramenti]